LRPTLHVSDLAPGDIPKTLVLAYRLHDEIRMVGLLLIRTGNVLARAVVLASSAVAPINDDWFAQTGLVVVLIILLVGGVAILAIGLGHLVRDLRQWYPRSHKITIQSSVSERINRP
jgi:hypothetical protein